MSPTEKLLNTLHNIKQLTVQTEEGIKSNLQVQKTHPDRLKRAETYLKLAHEEIKLVREEDEIGLGYWQEIEEAFPIIIGRMNDMMTKQQNLDFITATDKVYLRTFLSYVMEYGKEMFQEVLENMANEEFADIEDVIDVARRKRA